MEFGFIWEKIGEVQKGSLELKCHIHYRLLQTERSSICNFAISCAMKAQQLLKQTEWNIESIDGYYERNIDNMYKWDWGIFTKSHIQTDMAISVRRMAYKLLDIYETAPIALLLRIMYDINLLIPDRGLLYLIKTHFLELHDARKQTEHGRIRYIWEISNKYEYEKICNLCSPVALIEREKMYVIMYEESRWETGRDSFGLAKLIGKFSKEGDCNYNTFLENAGFPIANIYKNNKNFF